MSDFRYQFLFSVLDKCNFSSASCNVLKVDTVNIFLNSYSIMQIYRVDPRFLLHFPHQPQALGRSQKILEGSGGQGPSLVPLKLPCLTRTAVFSGTYSTPYSGVFHR